MNGQNPLENLRDIHLPEAIEAWPPAPGWWILGFCLIALVVFTIWKIWQKYQQKHLLRVSLATIAKLQQEFANHQDQQVLIKQYSNLLRRIALARFPRQRVASLTGSNWLNFLDDSVDMKLFNSDAGKLLLNAPYQRSTDEFSYLDDLSRAVELWIKVVNSNNTKQTTTVSTTSLEKVGSSV